MTVAVLGLLTLTMIGRAQTTGAATTTTTTAPASATSAPGPVSAQPPPPSMTNFYEEPPAFHPFTIGIEGGTTGVGMGADWRFMNHLGVGAAIDYLPVDYNHRIHGNEYDGRLRLISEPLTLNIYPWAGSSFRVSGGVLLNQNRLTGDSTGNITLNGTSYTGTANLEIKQQPVNPYGSIGGNLYFGHARRVSLGFELGAFYTGSPRVNLTATTTGPTPPTLASDVQHERSQIVHYARYAEVWPVLKISLKFSF
jgi:hypothetical protein